MLSKELGHLQILIIHRVSWYQSPTDTERQLYNSDSVGQIRNYANHKKINVFEVLKGKTISL